jgi:hypothetical protein
VITVYFEEWILEENALPRRTVQSYEYNSLKTKLWHTDDNGELYLRVGAVGDLEGVDYLECSIADCYYQLRPPENLDGTVFKNLKGLQEHYRRAHYFQDDVYSPLSQLPLSVQSSEIRDSSSGLASMEPSIFLSEDVPSDLGAEFTPALQPIDEMEWSSVDDLMAGDSFNSNQYDIMELQQPDPSDSLKVIGDTSQIHFQSISTSKNSIDSHNTYQSSNTCDEEYLMTSTPNSSTPLAGNGSMVSRTR